MFQQTTCGFLNNQYLRDVCYILCFCFFVFLPRAIANSGEQLKAVPAVDWPIYGHNYANHRFSQLSQVNHVNVGNLKLAWSFHTGKIGSFQATPIVLDGVLYLSTPWNDVLALDAANGEVIWRYHHQLTTKKTCCGPANRGVAVGNDKVYTVTIDARLIALDQKTGKVAWDVPITDPQTGRREALAPLLGETGFENAKIIGGTGYSANMAPQIYDGKVFVGITGAGYGLHLDMKPDGDTELSVVGLSGGGHGLRGFLVSYDAESGQELWRWYTVQDETWVGEYRETTPGGEDLNRDIEQEKKAAPHYKETWRLGGGSIWTTPAIDPESGLMFVGTGNPAPQMDDSTRPGDNLNTVSLVAIHMANGKTAWVFQQVPHDRWGYDAACPPVLLEVNINGQPIKAVAQAGKTGWVYFLERQTGRLLFKSKPFVPQRNMFKRPSEQGVEIAPGIFGGASWSPMAYNPKLRSLYVVAVHHPTTYFSKQLQPSPERPWQSYTYSKPSSDERWGTVTAIDSNTGAIRWQRKTDLPMVGGALSTAGKLVFAGEGDGKLLAMHAETGEILWRYTSAFGVNAPPVTYAVDGKQYIAVVAGGNKLFGYKTGDLILAFTLDDK
ncbi:MAG: PQQ-binding-like beta-propeller repeat protein [Deltaproteobacteria bacterium]|jgi:glucose dehydrogenase|nr:PQQ-binding-like beta-propeller repeat protein [Deltaproteobacteria bacterium]